MEGFWTPESGFLQSPYVAEAISGLSDALRASAAILRMLASLHPQSRRIERDLRLKVEFLDGLRLLGEGRVVDWQEMQP